MAQARLPRNHIVSMVSMMAYLPGQWMFVHIVHMIAQLKMNKMTLQNVSIVLSPTMKISHR